MLLQNIIYANCVDYRFIKNIVKYQTIVNFSIYSISELIRRRIIWIVYDRSCYIMLYIIGLLVPIIAHAGIYYTLTNIYIFDLTNQIVFHKHNSEICIIGSLLLLIVEYCLRRYYTYLNRTFVYEKHIYPHQSTTTS